MLALVDSYVNRITMYRLVLYYLCALLGIAVLYSTLGVLSFNPVWIIASTVFVVSVAWVSNYAFAWAFNTTTNTESVYISALILALVISPISPANGFWFLLWAGVWVAASKFIFAYRSKHLFNPVAITLVLCSLVLDESATWWVGGIVSMLPFVLVGGLLIVRKMRRFALVGAFFAAVMVSTVAQSFISGLSLVMLLQKTALHSPLFFFAFIILTEPLTTPPTRWLQAAYGAIVGLLFAPWIHLGSLYSSPEIAIVLGNLFAFAVSPKARILLTLQKVNEIAHNTYEYVFRPAAPVVFIAGQYAEWTLPMESVDARGNRRSFSIASAPGADTVSIAAKIFKTHSFFKAALKNMAPGSTISLSNVMGDFVLPADASQKVAFIAGGIGVTPFISMLRYDLAKEQKRDAVLIYANDTEADIAYSDILRQAEEKSGLRKVLVLSGREVSASWKGERGLITQELIHRCVPDFRERLFYVSGPEKMVTATSRELVLAGVPRSRIKKDFFAGL